MSSAFEWIGIVFRVFIGILLLSIVKSLLLTVVYFLIFGFVEAFFKWIWPKLSLDDGPTFFGAIGNAMRKIAKSNNKRWEYLFLSLIFAFFIACAMPTPMSDGPKPESRNVWSDIMCGNKCTDASTTKAESSTEQPTRIPSTWFWWWDCAARFFATIIYFFVAFREEFRTGWEKMLEVIEGQRQKHREFELEKERERATAAAKAMVDAQQANTQRTGKKGQQQQPAAPPQTPAQAAAAAAAAIPPASAATSGWWSFLKKDLTVEAILAGLRELLHVYIENRAKA